MQALTLAYIGDSIYDIMSREYVMKNHLGKINDLHKTVSTIVSARAQASFMENILNNSILTEQEEKIYNRAKNQKNNSKAKNASIMEYKLATGLEAVFGYLYLEKNVVFVCIIDILRRGYLLALFKRSRNNFLTKL